MYLDRARGDGYRVIGTTTIGKQSSEMDLDPNVPVGFRVVAAPLAEPQPGSLEAALIAAGQAAVVSLPRLTVQRDLGF